MAVSTNPTLIAQLQGRKFGSHDVLRFLNFFLLFNNNNDNNNFIHVSIIKNSSNETTK